MENEKIMKLSPPWYFFQKQVNALFGSDPQVYVKDLSEIVDGSCSLMILVDDKSKASAIKEILPQEIQMSNVKLNVLVLGPDENFADLSDKSITEIYDIAFSGNPIFVKTITRTYNPYMSVNYCIFKKEVTQFWDDDLSDYCGNFSGLASQIAGEILNHGDISYCIESE